MKKNNPIVPSSSSASITYSSPVIKFFNLIASKIPSPIASVTTVFPKISIFGLFLAFSAVTFSQRTFSLRYTIVTLRANLVKNKASSTALLAPPTT